MQHAYASLAARGVYCRRSRADLVPDLHLHYEGDGAFAMLSTWMPRRAMCATRVITLGFIYEYAVRMRGVRELGK